MDPITLWVRSPALQRVAPIEDYGRATLIPRFNDVGAWLIEGMPLASTAAQLLVPGAGIVAMQGDTALLSGPLLFPEITWDQRGYTLNASGSDDMLAVYGRLAFPDPTSYPDGAGQWSVYSDDRSGPAETVMKEYVEANAGPTALTDRRWSGLAVAADQGLGDAVSYSARNIVLGELLEQLALAGGGLRFNVVQVGTALEFDVTEPTDRSATARFSPTLGNLRGLKYGRKAAATNWVLVGGGGDGVARVFYTLGNSASITQWGFRLESFRDQRQTSDTTELMQAAQEQLETQGDQDGIELQPIDTELLEFGTGYQVGDVVTVIVDGQPIADVVREARIELTEGGTIVTPVVGTPGQAETSTDEARALDLLFQRLRQTGRRLAGLEVAQ